VGGSFVTALVDHFKQRLQSAPCGVALALAQKRLPKHEVGVVNAPKIGIFGNTSKLTGLTLNFIRSF
tara:strand:- start:415 stop:615 length:201 start_codon:yes stop_codon:yes gene_type:complete